MEAVPGGPRGAGSVPYVSKCPCFDGSYRQMLMLVDKNVRAAMGKGTA